MSKDTNIKTVTFDEATESIDLQWLIALAVSISMFIVDALVCKFLVGNFESYADQFQMMSSHQNGLTAILLAISTATLVHH